MILNDLVQEIGQPPRHHPPIVLRRMAVHEAGHAVAFSEMGPGVLQRVVVDPLVGSTSATTVDVISLYQDMPHASREEMMLQLRAVLAGRAAEEVILGNPSGGAGGSDRSDLARATTLVCMLVTSSGLDDHRDGLIYMASAQDVGRHEHLLLLPEIRQRISDVLRRAYDNALTMVRKKQSSIIQIADILLRDGMISGRDVEAILVKGGDPS